MAVYDDILANAPNGDFVAAGHLHEELWEALLRLESPDLHNVRLGRGDGGIDGVEFLDPVLGTAHIYQAKFFPNLDEGHQAAVLKAFCTAHKHEFPCVKWTLLVPSNLSAPELNWLHVGLRKEAATLLQDPAKSRCLACEIRFKDATDLEDMLRRNLGVAAQRLPNSVMAYEERLKQEREKASAVERELTSRLREIQDAMIRERERQTGLSIAAIGMLNQGWQHHRATLELLLVRLHDSEDTGELASAAKQLEEFCESRMREAYYAEGIGSGFARLVAEIHRGARRLGLAAGAARVVAPTATVETITRQVLESVKDLQRKIGTVLEQQLQ